MDGGWRKDYRLQAGCAETPVSLTIPAHLTATTIHPCLARLHRLAFAI
jgi:hypothetical protein